VKNFVAYTASGAISTGSAICADPITLTRIGEGETNRAVG
jgi:hypothetical protein